MQTLKTIADMICIAARTAPKAKGVDNIVTKIITKKEKNLIAKEMDKVGAEYNHKGFIRDAGGIRIAQEVILIGTKFSRLNLLVCGNCGYKNCADAEKNNAVCTFNPGDLGIAVGSAVSIASDFRVDNRIMYTAGLAAKKLNILPKSVKLIYAIPLSVTGKNPFFDR